MSVSKALLLGLLLTAGSASSGGAFTIGPSPRTDVMIRADWQVPEQLPPQFRNHCSWDKWSNRPYCSNRCGIDYQFFHCSAESFGCCHLGHGYCDWSGLLRCTP